MHLPIVISPLVPPRRTLSFFVVATLLGHVIAAAATAVSPKTFGASTSVLLVPRSGSDKSANLDQRSLAASRDRRYPLSVPTFLSVRGGASEYDDEDYDDEYDEESDFDFDDEFGFDDGDLDAGEDDFGESGTVERMYSAWQKTPPFTKAYLSASAVATAMGYITNKNQFPSIFLLEWKAVLTKLQIWRPFTAFLNVGPFGLGYAMTAQFVWTYMATLERMNHSHPYDFWFMIVFGCASMVAGYTFLNIPPTFLGHNLSTFLVYVWSRYHEGMEVNMFELFNTRAEMLPWMFLAQTFLLEGAVPTLDLLGILFGHIYHHLSTTNALRTPKFVVNWYNGDSATSKMIRSKYKEISSDYEMQ
mmetsp:Transcript_35288/g.77295  ORF Transcript_35288/g.77295 Transcript_35288/m.77295 type:complete len:360 (+) Transcript_35288:175-1254(+)